MCNCNKISNLFQGFYSPVKKIDNTNCLIVPIIVEDLLTTANSKKTSIKLNIIKGQLQSMLNLGEYCRYDVGQIKQELDVLI